MTDKKYIVEFKEGEVISSHNFNEIQRVLLELIENHNHLHSEENKELKYTIKTKDQIIEKTISISTVPIPYILYHRYNEKPFEGDTDPSIPDERLIKIKIPHKFNESYKLEVFIQPLDITLTSSNNFYKFITKELKIKDKELTFILKSERKNIKINEIMVIAQVTKKLVGEN